MRRRIPGLLPALALGLALAAQAAAQQRPTIAIMPTQYFSADAGSAETVTRALAEQFESHGYTVIPLERARATFEAMGLSPSRHFSDTAILQFGRRIGADLVARPQLLALGVPAAGGGTPDDAAAPAAVLYLRVLNARSGRPIYTRQVRQRFTADRPVGADFTLPRVAADAVATEVTRLYFERVAGSRQELPRAR